MFSRLAAKKKRNLGKYNRQLIIRILRKGKVSHIILTRQRNRSSSRLAKLGFFEVDKRKNEKDFLVIGIHWRKFNHALSLGAKIHSSVMRIIF